jgi:hypothetical protein
VSTQHARVRRNGCFATSTTNNPDVGIRGGCWRGDQKLPPCGFFFKIGGEMAKLSSSVENEVRCVCVCVRCVRCVWAKTCHSGNFQK